MKERIIPSCASRTLLTKKENKVLIAAADCTGHGVAGAFMSMIGSSLLNEIVNKKVMLFIPSDDEDYDNVYLTTSENIGYKMGFAMGEEKQKLSSPRQTYVEPVNLEELEGKPGIQYK